MSKVIPIYGTKKAAEAFENSKFIYVMPYVIVHEPGGSVMLNWGDEGS